MKFLFKRFSEVILLGWTWSFFTAIHLPALVQAQSQTPNLRSGQWEITQSMEGGPKRRDATKKSACLNDVALAQPEVSFRKAVTNGRRDVPGCKVADVTRFAGGVTWSASCDNPRGGAPIPALGKANYSATDYESVQTLNLETPFGKFDLKETIRANYLGVCH
jgi:hypothetical protein